MDWLPAGALRRAAALLTGSNLQLAPTPPAQPAAAAVEAASPLPDDLLAVVDFYRGVEVKFLGRGPQFEEIPE